MKKLLLSTALVAAGAFGAVAQTADGTIFQTEAQPGALRASELIGMRVYNSEAAIEGDAVDGVGQDWDDLGEINDVVLSRDGRVDSVLVDVGGFLGVGERQVAVSMTALKFVADDATGDAADDFFLVMNAPRATLDEAPAFTMSDAGAAIGGAAAGVAATAAAAGDAVVDGAEATGDAVADGTEATADAVTGDAATGGTSDQQAVVEGGTSDQQAVVEGGTSDQQAVVEGGTSDAQATTEGQAMAEGAEATTSTTGADAEAQARAPLEREGFGAATPEMMTADALTGARVYDANDEWIGDVSELVLTTDGQIDQAVIDVGGFLGIGEKPVAVSLGDMDILQQTDGTEVRVFLQRTKEELEALPNYEG